MISSEQAFPNQLLSVSHSSIQENDIVDVVFQSKETPATAVEHGAPSYQVTIKAIARAAGVVDVAVPPVFDDSGLPVTRDMRVLVNGVPSRSVLRIEGLQDLGVPTDGMVLGEFLLMAIDDYSMAIENLNTIAGQLSSAVDVRQAQAAMSDQMSLLQAQLDEITHSGTLTVEVDGLITVLSPEQLDVVDRWLLHSLISMEVASQQPVSGIVVAAQNLDTYRRIKDAWEEGVRRMAGQQGVSQGVRDFVNNGIPDTLNKAQEALRKGTTYLGGYVSLMAAGAGLWGDKALGVAASAANMAAAQYSASISTFNAWWAQQNTDSFLNGARQNFDLGQEMLSQLARVGTAYLGGAGSKLADTANTALTVKDMLSEAEVDLCRTPLSPSLLCSSGDQQSGDQSASDFTVIGYANFDDATSTASGGQGLDPREADIRLSGNPAFPVLSWQGRGISLVVYGRDSAILYGIVSTTDPETDNLISFGSPVRYGDYSIPNVELPSTDLDPSSVPALQPQQVYVASIQRSDFKQAALYFMVK